jgi:hypothetical protein
MKDSADGPDSRRLLLLLVSFAFGAFLVFGERAVRAQEPPRLSASVMDVGREFSIRLRGGPGSPYALVVDTRVAGPRRFRFGEVAVDGGPGLRIIRDGIRRPGPVIPEAGRIIWTATILDRAELLGTRCTFQAFTRDVANAHHIQVSNALHRTIGNGSTGDYRQQGIELPWPEDYYLAEMKLIDVDGDDDLDILVGSLGAVCPLVPLGDHLRLFLNDGAGQFVDASSGLPGEQRRIPLMPDINGSFALDCGDIDGDGDPDILAGGAICPSGLFKIHILLNDGAGFFSDVTFTLPRGTPEPSQRGPQVVLADVDGDSDLDAVVTGRPTSVWINSNGLGLFVETWATADARIREYLTSGRLGVSDVNGDGHLDIVTSDANVDLVLFLNDGTGVFRRPEALDEAGLPDLTDQVSVTEVVFFDADGDNDLDLFLTSTAIPAGKSQDRLLINSNGRGLFIDGTFGPTTGIPLRTDVSGAVAVGDVDRDGDIDLLVDGRPDGDQLFLNNGIGFFVDGSDAAMSGLPQLWEANEATALGDLDGDGDLDVVTVFTRPRSGGGPGEEGVKVLFNN